MIVDVHTTAVIRPAESDGSTDLVVLTQVAVVDASPAQRIGLACFAGVQRDDALLMLMVLFSGAA